MVNLSTALAPFAAWPPIGVAGMLLALSVAGLPAAARAQSPDASTTPKVEVGATVGFGGMMTDESYRGGGLSGGADVGVRVWRRVWLGFAADYLRTSRDFSSDVHWNDETVLMLGTLSYRFTSGRVQPVAQFGFGGARVHHTTTYPTYTVGAGQLVTKGPDATEEGITTATAVGFGGGVHVRLTHAMTLGGIVKVTSIAGTYSPRGVTQGLLHLGYGWGGQPGPAAPAQAPAPSAAPAQAQPPAMATSSVPGVARTLDELRLLVKVGDTVTITDSSAGVASGRITSLSPSAIELNADGRLRTWTEADIAQIQHRRSDSLGNGALWGFGIGVGWALAVFAAAGVDAVDEEAGWMVLEAGVYGAMGAGIGVGVDALIKKTVVIYAHMPGGSSARIVPIVAGGRRGVALRLAF